MKTLMLVGSPRGRRSSSSSIADYLSDLLKEKGQETEILWITEQLTSEDRTTKMLDAVWKADAIVLTAPLYDDCQPAIVTKTLELIAVHPEKIENMSFIPIINCGFPEPSHITAVAIPIYHKFASTAGFKWLGSIAIGGGEALQGAQGKQVDEVGSMANSLKVELDLLVQAMVEGKSYSDTSIVAFPKFFLNPIIGRFFVWMNNRGWKSQADKNGVRVDAQPYI